MIESNAVYQDYTQYGKEQAVPDRLPLGFALLAVVGLSLLSWAVILIPLVAILD